MSNQSTFETINDADLDEVSGGRVHRGRVGVGVGRSYGYAGAYGYGYGTTVPAIAPYATAYPAAYPAYGYGAYGMRLGTAI